MHTWILLSESRGRVLRIWNICTGLVLFLVLIQTVTGKLAGIEGTAWLWVTINLIPGLFALNASAWLNKSPAKIMHPAAHKAMLAAAAGYLALVCCVLLFSQAAIAQNDYGLDTWLGRSLFLLIPFQAVVLFSFWLLYFKKESIFRPNPQIILDIASKKAQDARRTGKSQRLKCLEQIAANDLAGAFDSLKACFEKSDSERLHEMIVLNGEYSRLLRDTQLNVLDPAQAQRSLNRVVIATLELTENVHT